MTSPSPRNSILQAALAGGACALIVASAAMAPRPAPLPSQRVAMVGQRQDTGQFDVLLRVRSTEPGREVRFKAAYDVDDRGGLQFVETTTPFQTTGRTHAATAMLQKLGGDAELDAALVVGTGADTLRASAASGPRLVLRYDPRLAQLQSSLNGPPCRLRLGMGEYLRDLAFRYHPEAFGHDSMVVGFVFDKTCQVVRHGAAHWPTSDSLKTSEDVLAKVLPGIRTGPEYFSSSGGSSPAPPLAHTQPVIVYGVLK